MSIAVGSKGLDSASPSINEPSAFASGSRFRMRYSAGAGNASPNSAFKLCQPGEIAAILASGQDFIANSEWTTGRILGGSAAGAADGAADLAFWKSRGLRQGASIYVSWDQKSDPSQYDAAAAYMASYNSALGGYYRGDGLYADIPALVAMSHRGVLHGWISESPSFSVPKVSLASLGISAPPAVTTWDLWEPTPSQIAPASAYLLGQMAGHQLASIIWQDGNHWFSNAADENVALYGSDFGSYLGSGSPTPPPAPPAPTPPTPAPKLYQGMGVPALIARGSGQYFGSIDGPKASHGGFNAAEIHLVQILQERLIVCGFVPGVTNPFGGWADGIFDTRGGGVGSSSNPADVHGATSLAVERFQRAHKATSTSFWGQCWDDDWSVLFNL